MKTPRSILLTAFVLAIVAVFILAGGAHAQGPSDLQPWMYAAVQFSGLGTAQAVQADFRLFRDNQGSIYQYTTPAMWNDSYNLDATIWMRQHGCSSCEITENGLSFKLKVDAPVYQRSIALRGLSAE